MAQQALGRHDDQRLAPGPQHLAAQQVEELRRRGRLHDLEVVLGGELQEALEAAAAVLRAHALEAVRQQQHQARQEPPLVLARGDELVDDHLRGVDEVAELRLPHDQRVGVVQAVAVLEAQHAGLRERAVDEFHRRLVRREVLQRDVARAGGHVVQHGVAMAEGAALAVLAAEAHALALGRQRGEGQGLGGRPVERLLARRPSGGAARAGARSCGAA